MSFHPPRYNITCSKRGENVASHQKLEPGSLGSEVAYPHWRLSFLQDYPEYYRIITEPIDLNMIKKNVEVCARNCLF